MKKSLKVFLIILLAILVFAVCLITYVTIITAGLKIDDKKLVDMDKTITFYDEKGEVLVEEAQNVAVTDLSNIPDYVKKAFVSIEDKRFYKHKGVDYRGLARATLNNLKSFSFKEGASTISQQLVKNTHLSNEKTFNRKLKEIKLAKKLEKIYTKDQILEKYLNTIYFGDGCYGITSASHHYFNKEPYELTINESATLAGIIKAPSNYSPTKSPEKCLNRRNIVLTQMYEQGFISEEEYHSAIKKKMEVANESKSNYNALYFAKNQFNELLDNKRIYAKKYKIYTSIDSRLEKIIEDTFSLDAVKTDKSAIILDKTSKIKAYYSTCGEILRSPGSTIKPILCYAPAIENDVVTSYTLIDDEKTDFNGYSPSNYGEKYKGKISVKESILGSSNVCAVKLLNYTGIEKASSYLTQTGISLTNNDNALCIALGATEKGATLKEITSSYTVFSSNGEYYTANIIEKITDENGVVLYVSQNEKRKVFSDDTCHLINDMLNENTINGTARNLKSCNVPLCSKTGTVGTKEGNLDAYSISYNSEYLLGIWYGKQDNSLMDNSITGGSLPTNTAKKVWDKTYEKSTPPTAYTPSEKIKLVTIDKESYYNDVIELADENAPPRYILNVLDKKSKLFNSRSSRFSNPTIQIPEYSVNNKCFSIRLCLPEYYNYFVFRQENNQKELIFDSNSTKDKSSFTDEEMKAGKTYDYSLIPYFINKEGTIFYGQEINFPKIKIPNETSGEPNWWKDEF